MHKCSLVFVMIPIKHFFYNPQKYSYFRGILILHLFLCKAFRDVIQIHIGTYSPLHFSATYMYLVVKKMIENDVSYRHSSPLPKQDLFSHPQDFLCVCLVSEKDLWYSHVLMFLAKTFGLVFLNSLLRMYLERIFLAYLGLICL